MAAAAPAAAAVAAPAATAGAGAAAGGGMAALMSSPWFQIIAPAVLGVVAGQHPGSARGVATGLGAFNMLQDYNNANTVAEATQKYSDATREAVDRELLDRKMNEAVTGSGIAPTMQMPGGGAFLSTGPAPTTYGTTDIQTLQQHGAMVEGLPAMARANPSQAGYLLANAAKQAPVPMDRSAPPNLYNIRDQFMDMFPGHNIGANMSGAGVLSMSASPKAEPKPVTEAPEFTAEELAAAMETIKNLPPGAQATYEGQTPGGEKLSVLGRGPAHPTQGDGKERAPAPGTTGRIVANPMAGQLIYNRQTGQYELPSPEVLEYIQMLQAMQDEGAPIGEVVRGPDGKLTIRR
jgi:hypothetical protein